MNREQEYSKWMEELENNIPDLAPAVERARQRKRKAAWVYRPLVSAAACFAIFVLLVNFSAPVAGACARIPVLRELAAAVTFSRSLSDAVENAYVQPMELEQSQNHITAQIAYLIVDQKQVNVFYRLDSDVYDHLAADPEVLNEAWERPESCSYHTGSFDTENGALRSLTIDFVEGTVPGKLRLKLKVYSNGSQEAVEAAAPDQQADQWDVSDYTPNYLAQFDFLLEFDPEFTAAGKIIPVDKTVELEGQKITVKQIQIFPTHMRVDIADDPDNTAWLKDLEFSIQTDNGMTFEASASGITATGSENSPTMTSYRADSTYFYEADHLELVITGAQWLRKDMEKTWVNLKTGETGPLPEGVAFEGAEKSGNIWTVSFRGECRKGEAMYQIFGHQFFDAEGTAYEINARSTVLGEENENGETTYFLEKFPLRNYSDEEVWLSPLFSHTWTAEEEIRIAIP